MNTTLRQGWRSWLMMLALGLLLCTGAGQARASVVVNSVLVNGGAVANVSPGDTITVSVTVTLTSGSRWRSTVFTTSPGSSLSLCSLSPDISIGGTYTRTFTMTAPSTNGVFSLNVAAWTNPNCNGTASPTKTLPSGINTGPVTLTLNHVRITHDGTALTCSPETVTLKACANAACTTTFTDNVTVSVGSTLGAWSSNPVTLVNGVASVNLSSATAGTATLSGTVTSPSATTTALTCYRGSVAGDCALVFSNASCSLDAVETAKAPNTAILTKRIGGGVVLDVLALNNGVINTSSTATIVAQLVAGNAAGCTATTLSPTVTFTLTGANAGRRSVTFAPTAAARNARVRLTSGSLVGCSSDNFAIRPSSLAISSVAAQVGADATGVSTSASPIPKAGTTAFTLNADAGVGYDGTPTINNGMLQSSSTNAGNLAGGFGVASAAVGQAQGTAFTYSEVGYFRLGQFGVYDDVFADIDEAKSPADCFTDSNLGSSTAPADPNVVAADGKIGCYFGNAQTAYFGRFIPDHFDLSSPAMLNRSASSACATSTFTYMGEAMTPTATLTAMNGLGGTTSNYEGGFARLTPATQLGMGVINAPATGTRTPFPACTATPAHPCITAGAASGTFVDGEAPDVTAPFTVFRGSTAVGPFDNIKVGFAPVDADGVKLATYDIDTLNPVAGANNHALVGTSLVRYGRMGIDNGYGSELLNLTLKLSAQYWSGAGYATNTLDSCTVPAFTPFVLTDYSGGINATNMPFSKVVAGPGVLNGVGQVVLTKPGLPVPTVKGSVTVRSSLGYLPGNARATFGVYKAGPVIYVRETY
jgi:MSHA biogenesis protein MshQ